MAKRQLPGLGLTAYWPYGSDNWNLEMDTNLRLLSAVAQINVASRTVAIADMDNTKMYIVPDGSPTNAKSVAIYDDGVWVYLVPKAGWLASINGGSQYRYNGSDWVLNVAPPAWGTFTGTLADQADLQAALALRLAKTGGTMGGQLNLAPILNLAVATTPAIGAADCNTINITGSGGPITGFDSIASGAVRTLVFAGVVTLTHHATNLILPNGANITTAAGDVLQFTSLGDGHWKCTGKMVAADSGGSGGGMWLGTLIAWPLSEASIPAGSIANNGQLVNRATWPELWALYSSQAISDATWLADPLQRGKPSTGNGSTTFRMPDLNGKHADGLTPAAAVLRGHGKNSAGTPGLFQLDQFQGFKLGSAMRPDMANVVMFNDRYGASAGSMGTLGLSATTVDSAAAAQFSQISMMDNGNGVPRVGTETRATNATVVWITVGATGTSNPGTVDVTALATHVTAQDAVIAGLQGKPYVSSPQTITSAGTLTFTHGLGVKPSTVTVTLICTSAEAGYAIGDEVPLIGFQSTNSTSASRGFSTWASDTTSVGLVFGSLVTATAVLNKTTGVFTNLTNSKWTAIVRIYP